MIEVKTVAPTQEKRMGSAEATLQPKSEKKDRDEPQWQKGSYDWVGDLAFWLDSRAQFFSVKKEARLSPGSMPLGFRQEIRKHYLRQTDFSSGPHYSWRRAGGRKPRKAESDGPELKITNQRSDLLQRNRELRREIEKRASAEDRIRETLREKDLLLKEVQHRFKNNLQCITTLLDLHSDCVSDYRMQSVIFDIQSRIKSMAIMHELLYQSKNSARIDFREYLRNLVDYIFACYGKSKGVIKPDVSGGDCFLSLSSASSCGLIAHELVSNSLKHGFPGGRQGLIFVYMYTMNKNFHLVVRDNGIGFPKNFKIKKTTTLGLQLVVSLVEQLKGRIDLNRRGGTEFRVAFPEK